MRWSKASYAAGLLFAACLVAGIVNIDDYGQTPEEVTKYVTESQGRLAASFLLITGAAVLLQWFVAGVSRAVADATLRTVAVVSGSVGSAGILLSGALLWAPGEAFNEDAFPIDASAVELITTAGYGALVGGFMSLGAFAVATCLGAALPAWLRWSGLVLGALQLVAFMFMPMVLLTVWVAALAVTLLGRRSPQVVDLRADELARTTG